MIYGLQVENTKTNSREKRMQHINSITSQPKQRMSLVLENNETVDFYLYYLPRQFGWFYNFTYKDFTVNCSRATLSPNALRQFKNIIPFGIAFTSNSFIEPFDIDDFSSGRVNMYVLNSDDVKQIENEIFNL